ncbi:MAG: DUF3833 domain-containing protein [Pseudomonadota bacterium]
MLRLATPLLLTLVFTTLAACSSVQVTDYRDFEPAIDLETFFDGPMTAHGVVKDRRGRVIRLFNADIQADWQAGVGTLDEQFLFDDGEKQYRKWTLTPVPDASDQYIGTAGDVVGEGKLSTAGNSVFLDYTLRIPYGDGTIDVRVDDRMYLLTPDVLINESVLTKFNVRVGSLLLVILRSTDNPSTATIP